MAACLIATSNTGLIIGVSSTSRKLMREASNYIKAWVNENHITTHTQVDVKTINSGIKAIKASRMCMDTICWNVGYDTATVQKQLLGD